MKANQQGDLPIYLDTTHSFKQRAEDLVARMTLEEKVSQMVHPAPAIERLGIPDYNWWNECLHGVARAGIATVFPQAIGLAAAWNPDLLEKIAEVISTEARAKHHLAAHQGQRGIFQGLTFWSPNVNIFRDPRWGRGQETYGEDPYLTARLGVVFVRGLQGEADEPDGESGSGRYLKVVATPKHFAAHSGPEHERHHINVQVSEHDLWETYLPAFEACIVEGKAASIMGAYNRVNGEPCCASPTLLENILRQTWGFEGYVVSDCGAIRDIFQNHKFAGSLEEAVAVAVKAGCDLNCGQSYPALVQAVRQGLLSEEDIDRSVKRLFQARFQLGMFDAPETVSYAQIPPEVIDSEAHRSLALQAARESIVLLKNQDACLPLPKTLKKLAVIGPNADEPTALLGNYNGTPSRSVTPLAGIRAMLTNTAPGTVVEYAPGCGINGSDRSGFDEALALARQSDIVIFVGGLSQLIEGEEGQEEGVQEGMKSRADRAHLSLPETQQELLQALYQAGAQIVLVLLNGSPIALRWSVEHLPAIVEAWYPGEEGGTALAEVLFGDYNPAGRLPITFYRSVNDLPPFEDYHMEGRTYRYFRGKALFPFGFGLSYTSFHYSNLRYRPSLQAGETQTIEFEVENSGRIPGDEVAQLYISDLEASFPVPIHHLEGFRRLHLEPGEKQTVSFQLTPAQMASVDQQGRRVVEPGLFRLAVGGRQPEPGEQDHQDSPVLFATFEVTGNPVTVKRPRLET